MQATRALSDAFERLTDARKQAAKEPKRAAAQNASSKKARSPGLIDTWAARVFSHARLALEASKLRLETRSSGDERWRRGCLGQAACSMCARLRTGGECPRALASLPVGEPRNARGWTAESGVLRWTIREARYRHGGLKTGKNDHIMTGVAGEKGLAFSVGQEEVRRGCRYLTAFNKSCQPSNVASHPIGHLLEEKICMSVCGW